MIPDGARVLRTVEAHTGGELARLVVDGWPALPGATLAAQLAYQQTHHDDLRTALVCEPRGHAEAYGVVVLPSVHPDADVGALFLEPTGYGRLCGHGLLALLTWLGRGGRGGDVVVDTPSGLVRGRWTADEGASVLLPPAEVERDPLHVDVDGREVDVAVVCSGSGLVFVDGARVGIDVGDSPAGEVVATSLAIRAAVQQQLEEGVDYAVLLHDEPSPRVFLNTCMFGAGQLDRSPTGSGVAGRAALLVARGELGVGDVFTVQSRTGAQFHGEVVAVGPEGVQTRVAGRAHLLGRAAWWVDPSDPLGAGFLWR